MSTRKLLKSKYTRDFIIHDKLIPSANRIGGILKASGDISNIPKHILINAQKRGLWVHENISRMISGQNPQSDLDWDGFIEGFGKFVDKYQPDWLATEYPMYDTSIGAKGIADAVCIINDKLTILDFKTSSSLNMAAYGTQLQIYDLLVDNDKNFNKNMNISTNLAIVQLSKRGAFKYVPIEVDKKYAYSMINVYQKLIAIGAITRKS